MTKLLHSSWFAILLGSIMYLATTAVLIKPGKLVPSAPSDSAGDSSHETTPTMGKLWNYRNPEIEKLVEELKTERESLATREQQLKELSARVQNEKQELIQVTQMVYQVQQEIEKTISKTITRVKEDEIPNLKKLAKVYSGMSAEGAAVIMREMSEDQIAKILMYMKETEKSPILETLGKLGPEEAKRAALVTDKLRASVIDPPGDKKKTP